MSAQFPAAPLRILSGRIFSGQSGASREENLRALARFSHPEHMTEFLMRAASEGYQGLMTLVEPSVVASAKHVRKKHPGFAILPIVPNVPSYVRDATEHGIVGAGIRRLGRTGLVGMIRAAMAGAAHPTRLMKKDFATILSILCALEMGEMSRFRPPAIFLHSQMTDIALAFGNRRLFLSFARQIRARYGAEPGLVTANFVQLSAKLQEWEIPISLIATPLNREGYLMQGGIEAYRSVLDSGRFSLLADRVSIQVPTPESALRWALEQPGVTGAVGEML